MSHSIEGQTKEMAKNMFMKSKEIKHGSWASKDILDQNDLDEIDRQIDELFR